MIARLIRRFFWRHKWDHRANPYRVRKCTLCGRVDAFTTDGWGGSWATMIKGVRARHYSKGE